MIVSELIAELSKFPHDLEVQIFDTEGEYTLVETVTLEDEDESIPPYVLIWSAR